jgi:hypothetical protein
MNETLRKEVYGETTIWHYDSDTHHASLDKTDEHMKSLQHAYTLFKEYRSLFFSYVESLPNPAELLVRCYIKDNRIFYKLVGEDSYALPVFELTIGEYLQKYTNDAIFYFEELNKKYISQMSTKVGFISTEDLIAQVEPEPPEITQLDHAYTVFFNEFLAHTDYTLLPPIPPEEGIFNKSMGIVKSSAPFTKKLTGITKAVAKTANDFFRQKQPTKRTISGLLTHEQNKKLRAEVIGDWYNPDIPLETIIKKYKQHVNLYHPTIIKKGALAFGIPRLFQEYYDNAYEKILELKSKFDALKVYKENENEVGRDGGSKKYISRRKYKRTSTKTKRIRKLI